jgi:peptidoglycan/LPS O-acetylase OafA/YrhL
MRKLKALLVLGLLLVASQVFAQIVPEPTDKFDLTFVIGSAGAVAVYLATFGLKKVLPKIPKLAVLAIPLVLGGAATYVVSAQAQQAPGGWQFLLLGALAVVIDNVVKYVRQ